LSHIQNEVLVQVVAAGGVMGSFVARDAGLAVSAVTECALRAVTTAEDTRRAARAIAEAGVELLLFAGGDGTARDIFEVVADRIPMLGIPAGVKMHSAVFATSPASAGEVARRFLMASAGDGDEAPGVVASSCAAPEASEKKPSIAGRLKTSSESRGVRVEAAEVMDRDSSSGRGSPRLYGFARTPRVALLTQYAKSTPRVSDEAELRSACQRIAEAARDQSLTIIGPGTTTRVVKQLLGFDGTLDGVDVTSYGRPVALDVTEAYLLDATASLAHSFVASSVNATAPRVPTFAADLVNAAGSLMGPLGADPAGASWRSSAVVEAQVIVGVVGGQGYLFGRGNQQISAEVLRRVGRNHITVVASKSKLLALPDQRLFVDTGSAEVDAQLSGHIHVCVSARERMIYRVQGGSECVPAS
jgi:predicted polyphosphate/ATP-dependent NAD kinase